MTNFVCEECGYRFASKADCRGMKCQYCNRGKLKEESSADELLNDVD